MNDKVKEIPQAGPRKARLNRHIIAGKHEEEWEGVVKVKPMLILGWELTEDLMSDGKPFWVKTFGLGQIADSDFELAKKTKFFTNMFLDYEPGVSKSVDYVGQPCRIVLEHATSRAGNTYAKIKSVRDYDGEVAPLHKPAVVFDFYNPTVESLQNLFPWEIDYLKEAVDYKGSTLETMLQEVETNEQPSGPSF